MSHWSALPEDVGRVGGCGLVASGGWVGGVDAGFRVNTGRNIDSPGDQMGAARVSASPVLG
jgi:hypothetical protein